MAGDGMAVRASAAPTVEANLALPLDHLKPVAIELRFMQPSVAGRRLSRPYRVAGRYEAEGRDHALFLRCRAASTSASGKEGRHMPSACRGDAGVTATNHGSGTDVGAGGVADFRHWLPVQGRERPQSAAARSLIEDCCRALSRERQTIGITIDDFTPGERAAQSRSCSADRGACRSILLLREARERGDPRHR